MKRKHKVLHGIVIGLLLLSKYGIVFASMRAHKEMKTNMFDPSVVRGGLGEHVNNIVTRDGNSFYTNTPGEFNRFKSATKNQIGVIEVPDTRDRSKIVGLSVTASTPEQASMFAAALEEFDIKINGSFL